MNPSSSKKSLLMSVMRDTSHFLIGPYWQVGQSPVFGDRLNALFMARVISSWDRGEYLFTEYLYTGWVEEGGVERGLSSSISTLFIGGVGRGPLEHAAHTEKPLLSSVLDSGENAVRDRGRECACMHACVCVCVCVRMCGQWRWLRIRKCLIKVDSVGVKVYIWQ